MDLADGELGGMVFLDITADADVMSVELPQLVA